MQVASRTWDTPTLNNSEAPQNPAHYYPPPPPDFPPPTLSPRPPPWSSFALLTLKRLPGRGRLGRDPQSLLPMPEKNLRKKRGRPLSQWISHRLNWRIRQPLRLREDGAGGWGRRRRRRCWNRSLLLSVGEVGWVYVQ